MTRLTELDTYKKHLLDRYKQLIERSNDYKYVDEVKSDLASYKAMKVLQKINKVCYLDKSLM